MFVIRAESAENNGSGGVILKGTCDLTKYDISLNTILFDFAGNWFIVTGISLESYETLYSPEKSHTELTIGNALEKSVEYFVGRVLTSRPDVCILFESGEKSDAPNEKFLADYNEYQKMIPYLDSNMDNCADRFGVLAFVDYEKLAEGKPCVRRNAAVERPVHASLRGSELTFEQYDRLYRELAEMDIYLANTPEEYRFCKDKQAWQEVLSEYLLKDPIDASSIQYRAYYVTNTERSIVEKSSGKCVYPKLEFYHCLDRIAEKVKATAFCMDFVVTEDDRVFVCGLDDAQTSEPLPNNPNEYIEHLGDIFDNIVTPYTYQPYIEFDETPLFTDITEFRLPTGVVSIKDSRGNPVPFTVKRSYGHHVRAVLDKKKERLLKYIHTDDDYVIVVDCDRLVVGEEYVYRFDGEYKYSDYSSDEHCYSNGGFSGEYAVAIGTQDFNDDNRYNNTPFWFYEVYPSEDISGYHFKLINKERDNIFFRLAWMKADYFPEEVLSTLVDWTC